MSEIRRYADAIDAMTWARGWIEGIALQDGMDKPGPCARRFEDFSHQDSDGATLAYFRDDRPIAIAVILRDAWNYSVAMKVFEHGPKQDVSGNGSTPVVSSEEG